MRVFLLSLVAALTFAAASRAAPGRLIIGSDQDHTLIAETSDCEHFSKTIFTSFRAQVHDQEQREFPLTAIDALKVTASEEGGVSVRGWNRPFARLIVCRYAAANTKAQAARLLGSVSVSHAGGEITAAGPPAAIHQAWWVNVILYVPRRATVEIRASHGGVAIRNMSGSVTALTTSGGISLAQSTGRYRIATRSGGITLDRVTGSIDATSHDGAIALKVPPASPPAVEARIAGGGEILCTLRGCEGGQWSSGRSQLKFGSGGPGIRLNTTAAPIIISPVTF